ncbi:MAG: hypothetical protein NTX59_13910 [Elusimicrobia bacterium]|nr:hypothetical protein [Elusimicrobiota bacterium]
MGGKFTEKYKKRSLLATLLLLFRGRAKYVTIALLMAATSLPFVASTETIERMLELPPVAAFLKSMGLGSILSAINPRYSTAGFKAALDKATADSSRDSFWNKFLSSLNSTLPPAGSPSSMAMIRGGGDLDLFGMPVMKDEKSAGPVKGVVNAEEKARGEDGSTVSLDGLKAGGGADAGGVYGDLMGSNLAERHGDGSYGSSPFSRMLTAGGSVISKSQGVYNYALSQAGSRIPVPGSPQKVKGMKMGKATGFSWKNVGYKTKTNKINVVNTSKAPLFQLAATFSMTDSAYRSKTAAPEYQAAYEGSTYDGNDVNEKIAQTNYDTASAVPVPPAAFVVPDPSAPPTVVTPGVPPATPPTNFGPILGMCQQALSLIMQSVMLSIAGAAMVLTGMAMMASSWPPTVIAGIMLYIAGIMVCIKALMMAIQAMMIGMALIGMSQLLLGGIYVLGGSLAAAAAIAAMTGVGIVATIILGGMAVGAAVLAGMAAGAGPVGSPVGTPPPAPDPSTDPVTTDPATTDPGLATTDPVTTDPAPASSP